MEKYHYILQSNQPLGPSSRILTLQAVDSEKPLPFLPGQYAGISFRNHNHDSPVRCFSLVSSPDQNSILQFGIRLGGGYTKSIANLTPDTPITVYGPFGSFIFPESLRQPLVYIAGGIGVTPFISMVRYATTRQLPLPITLIYSNRTRSDIPFLSELRELAQKNRHFSYKVFVTQDAAPLEPEADIEYGKVTPQALRRTATSNLSASRCYICGPTAFMNAMARSLRSLDVPEDSIIIESFGQAAISNGSASSVQPLVYGSVVLMLAVFFFAIAAADTAKKSALPSSVSSPSTQNGQPSAYVSPSATPDYAPASDYVPAPQPVRQPRTTVS